MLSCFRIPCSSQGSFFIFSLTSFSSSALKIKREPPSSTKGPPIKMKSSATSRSINSACSSQKGCSRVPFDKSRFGPAEEITTNVFFIRGKPQASVHRVQPRSSRLTRSTALREAPPPLYRLAEKFRSDWNRRVGACGVRHLTERICLRTRGENRKMFAASCREQQAGSLCSPVLRVSGANRIDNARSFRLKCLLYANPAHIRWRSISYADSRLCISCDPFPSVGH